MIEENKTCQEFDDIDHIQKYLQCIETEIENIILDFIQLLNQILNCYNNLKSNANDNDKHHMNRAFYMILMAEHYHYLSEIDNAVWEETLIISSA